MIEHPEPVEPEAPVLEKPQPPWATARLSPVGREVVQTLLLAVAIFFGIQLFIAQPYQIFQESMERTLEPGQYVLVDKLTPRFDPYKRGDIVVLHPPPDWAEPGGAPFIKRVIGVAGDRVAIRDGRVFVNDAELVEPYVYREGGGPPVTLATGLASWTIGSGELFVMGDHRAASRDSRLFGPVPMESVVGRAFLRYWPIGELGVLPTPTYASPSAP